jgi:hypothetical protein
MLTVAHFDYIHRRINNIIEKGGSIIGNSYLLRFAMMESEPGNSSSNAS